MALTISLADQKRSDDQRALDERLDREQQNRTKLREFAAQLREPGDPYAMAPANPASPTFKIGEAKGFPHVTEPGATGERGNLSPGAYKQFMAHMTDAASRPDAASRDAATGRAAKVVAKDWSAQHGKEDAKAHILHEARAQATFVAREIGAKLGVDPISATAIGYSLERALEKEGFKTLANHAIDRVGSFTSSIASTASATGLRHSMETKLTQSMTWLAEHGVTREALKDAVSKHTGKLIAINEIASHPEAVQRAAALVANSGGALDAVSKVATDAELRKAVGSITLSTGEALSSAPGARAIGSVAILAGSAMRGDAAEETGRHAFRAALSIVGGAAGGVAGTAVTPGFGTVAGGIAGAEVGSRVADKILEVYDQMTGREQTAPVRSVSQGELAQSREVVQDRIKVAAIQEGAERGGKDGLQERLQGMQREHSMGRSPG